MNKLNKLLKVLKALHKIKRVDDYDIAEIYDSLPLNCRVNRKPKTKSNHVGIEIEFYSRSNPNEIYTDLLLANLADKTSLTEDGSLDDYGHELRILDTERNIKGTLKKVLKILKKHKAWINDTCGLHVHLDMRNRKPAFIYNNFLKFQPILHGLVKRNRINNEFCQISTPTTVASKYRAINFSSYNYRKTIEIRLHEGSLDFTKMSNWLDLLIKIANYKKSLTDQVKTADDIPFHGQVKKYALKQFNKRNVESYFRLEREALCPYF